MSDGLRGALVQVAGYAGGVLAGSLACEALLWLDRRRARGGTLPEGAGVSPELRLVVQDGWVR